MEKIIYLETKRDLRTRVFEFLHSNGYKKDDWRMYTKATVLFVSIAILYSYPFFISAPLWFLAVEAVLVGLCKAAVGMGVMHDASHESFSRKEWINYLLADLSMKIIGGDISVWKMQHPVIHHTYTNTGHDDDLGTGNLFRFSPKQAWKSHHKFQYLYAPFLYALMTLLWVTSKDFTQAIRYKKEGKKEFQNIKYRLIMITLSKIFYYLLWIVVPIIFWKTSFWGVGVFFLVMHLTTGTTLSFVFQPAHVTSLVDFPSELTFKNKVEHQLRTSCNYAIGNKAITWFTGGLNHQIEHHLFPDIPHVYYPEIAHIVQEYSKEEGIPYNDLGTYKDALINHIKFMKKLGDPNFV